MRIGRAEVLVPGISWRDILVMLDYQGTEGCTSQHCLVSILRRMKCTTFCFPYSHVSLAVIFHG